MKGSDVDSTARTRPRTTRKRNVDSGDAERNAKLLNEMVSAGIEVDATTNTEIATAMAEGMGKEIGNVAVRGVQRQTPLEGGGMMESPNIGAHEIVHHRTEREGERILEDQEKALRHN